MATKFTSSCCWSCASTAAMSRPDTPVPTTCSACTALTACAQHQRQRPRGSWAECTSLHAAAHAAVRCPERLQALPWATTSAGSGLLAHRLCPARYWHRQAVRTCKMTSQRPGNAWAEHRPCHAGRDLPGLAHHVRCGEVCPLLGQSALLAPAVRPQRDQRALLRRGELCARLQHTRWALCCGIWPRGRDDHSCNIPASQALRLP